MSNLIEPPKEQASQALAVANLVTLAAIGMFVLVASKALPLALGRVGTSASPVQIEVQALLLSLALIIMALVRVSDLRKRQEDLSEAKTEQYRLAYIDEASDLYNRRYLFDVVFPELSECAVAIMLLDLDDFKKVNDLYGHVIGDRVLHEVGKRVSAVIPDDAIMARLGGDEFAVCIQGSKAGEQQATRLAAAIIAAIDQPIDIGLVSARVSASIGIANADQKGAEPAAILHHADIAMYEAKRAGRNCYVWFDATMEEELIERNQIEADIRTGIEHGEFEPYFQPLLDLETSRVKGFEVLARWNHPARGMVMPDEFIPIAEANGTICELSLAVMKSALNLARGWDDDLTIAVNVSPVQFRDPSLPDRIKSIIDEIGFPADRLEIEISESVLLEDKTTTLGNINRLRKMGMRISLDDFGTGYASLSQLRELPFDRIKIDRSFIATLVQDKQSDAFVDAITALGKSFSLPITAEGVEDQFAHDVLARMGCTHAQGWLYGKAMPASAVAETFNGPSARALMQVEPVGVAMRFKDRRNYARGKR